MGHTYRCNCCRGKQRLQIDFYRKCLNLLHNSLTNRDLSMAFLSSLILITSLKIANIDHPSVLSDWDPIKMIHLDNEMMINDNLPSSRTLGEAFEHQQNPVHRQQNKEEAPLNSLWCSLRYLRETPRHSSRHHPVQCFYRLILSSWCTRKTRCI